MVTGVRQLVTLSEVRKQRVVSAGAHPTLSFYLVWNPIL